MGIANANAQFLSLCVIILTFIRLIQSYVALIDRKECISHYNDYVSHILQLSFQISNDVKSTNFDNF